MEHIWTIYGNYGKHMKNMGSSSVPCVHLSEVSDFPELQGGVWKLRRPWIFAERDGDVGPWEALLYERPVGES